MSEGSMNEYYVVNGFSTYDWNLVMELVKEELEHVPVVSVYRYVFNKRISTFYYNNERILNGY
jgi:hypothetical protein